MDDGCKKGGGDPLMRYIADAAVMMVHAFLPPLSEGGEHLMHYQRWDFIWKDVQSSILYDIMDMEFCKIANP